MLQRQCRSVEGQNTRCARSGGGQRRQAFGFRGERFGAAGLDESTRG